uniref:Ty1/Copia family ribonuclease HI n=1 Tax=Clostridioides difficile TaxID=1496 RepID=UPI001034D79B
GAKDANKVAEIKQKLRSAFTITDIGQIGTFIGIDCKRSCAGNFLTLSQERYIDTLVERFGCDQAKDSHRLPPVETIDFSGDKVDDTLPVRSLIGALLYISKMTRPDVTAAVSYMSRYLDHPTPRVFKYCKQILKYLKTTKHSSLVLGDIDGTSLVVYADANFAPIGDRRSQSGAVFKLAGSTVGWHRRKQKTVSTSTTEAEYISLAIALNENLWMQHLLEELDYTVQYPTVMYEDNQPAIAIATNNRSPALAKHISVKYHAIRDYQLKRYVDVRYIPTKSQLADGLTKVRAKSEDAHLLLGPQQCDTSQNQGEC